MKKLMIVSGIFAGSVFSSGIVFKFSHWPGAGALIAVGILSLSLIFLPLYFTLKIQEKKETKEKVLTGLTSLVCIGISLSVLFKVMHWPYANALGLVSLFILMLLFLPVYFITGIRNPDTKMNTILSSILIIGGCGLFLTLVSSPRSVAIKNEIVMSSYLRSEMILQSELKMWKTSNTSESSERSKLANNIIAQCEALKSEILLRETGCATLVGDHACKNPMEIKEGIVQDYFKGERSLKPQLEILTSIIKEYNQQLNKQFQQPIGEVALVSNLNETRTPGYINSIIQTEMFVIQNERQLLATR
jgi:hypothetical protein